jgi:hypothetical protein
VVVNETFSFERDSSPSAREAFSAQPKKTLFADGTEFCRIITAENKKTGDRGNEIFGSPWWIPRETFRKIVSRADPKGLGIADVARIQLAIAREFNPRMDWFCSIYLTRPAYGWQGKAARQLAHDRANIYWGGGADQVFLPNLPSREAENSSDWARLRFFGMLPDFF